MDVATEQHRIILTEKSSGYVEPSQLILWQNYTQILEETNEFIWLSNHNGWAHLYLYDLHTGQVKNPITQDEWMVRKVVHVDTKNRLGLFFRVMAKNQKLIPTFVIYIARAWMVKRCNC